MAQKMTLTAYLAQRGKKAKALTRGEAELLGIPYPLQAGWPRRYGALEIDAEVFEQLSICAEAARRVAGEKTERQRLIGVSKSLAAGRQGEGLAPSKGRESPVQGFALRQAKRYRSRNSVPWT